MYDSFVYNSCISTSIVCGCLEANKQQNNKKPQPDVDFNICYILIIQKESIIIQLSLSTF